jgi:NAD-dependent SIR2 family protein deacetylase
MAASLKRTKPRSPQRLVLFVGAGASRACGYALNSEVLPEIYERLASDEFGDEHVDEWRGPLLRFLDHLMPGGRKAGLLMITEVLSVIDHCLASGEDLLPNSSLKSLTLIQARWLLERAMAIVIRDRLHKQELRPKKIVEWIAKHQRRGTEVSVLSTNYDSSLDCALFRWRLDDWNSDYADTDFGFTWRDPDDGKLVHPSANPRIRLLKLHGSLNWLLCHRCGHIYVNFSGSIVQLADCEGVYSRCECGYEPLRAVLVAPSLVRQYRERNLLSVWRSATEALRLADRWVFAGYSLPAEDVGIRALLMRAAFCRDETARVDVVNLGDEPLKRYRQLFPKCRYTADGLKSFVDGESDWM